MSWQSSPYILLLFLAGFVSSIWVAYGVERSRRGRSPPSLVAFTVLCLAVAIWAFAYGVQLASTDPERKLLAFTVLHLGSVAVPPAWFAFSLAYTGRDEYLTPGRLVLLGIVPAALLVTLPSNPHSLALIDVAVGTQGSLTVLEFDVGPLYQLFLAYGYVLVLLGSATIALSAIRSAPDVRRGAASLLVGALIPLAFSLLHVFDLPPLGTTGVNLTPVSLSISSIAFGVAIVRYRVLDLKPIAREAVFEQIADGVVVLDDRWRIVDYNDAARELLGLTDSDVGQHVQAALSVDDEIVTDSETGVEVECPIGGEDRILRIARTRLDHGSETAGWIVAVEDVTDHRRQQRELEGQNERLDAFAAVISHDLRNSLTLIRGLATLARETGEDDHFEGIDATVSEMATFLTDLLALSHQGVAIGERSRISIRAVATDAARGIGDRGTVTVETDAMILADRTRLRQTFDNLFRNAVEHGGEGVAITVGDLPTGFFVADDGPGIPLDEREAVFEHGHTTSRTGTGLGLSIVQDVVAGHGWELAVSESETGGAQFEITGATIDGEVIDENRSARNRRARRSTR